MATITLDGRTIEAPETLTVLQVARREGVEIPTLCHHEALGPYGACRLCVVEAEGPSTRRSLVTSCTLPVTHGLSVATNSPAVQRARRMVLELLLGRSPRSERLRALARRHGVESTRFGTGREDDDCVRCGLCVRACRDAIGTSAISFAGRGQKRRVTAEFGKLSELCVGCGTCAAVCPTGVIRLVDEDGWRTVFAGDLAIARLALLRCASCGAPAGTRELRAQVASRTRELPQVEAETLCPECARLHRARALAALPA
jgi:NADH dehydrogenase/NADH:ubiquinone oxidoreductase subunit G